MNLNSLYLILHLIKLGFKDKFMQKVLVIRTSVSAEKSVSNKVIDIFIKKLRNKFPQLEIIERNLAKNPIPALDESNVEAIRAGVSKTQKQADAINLAENLVDELKQVDAVILGVPRYNFNAPTTLKTYFDYIARPRITFAYGQDGVKGLLPNIPVYALVVSGGIYSTLPQDNLSLWLNQILSFVGLEANIIHTEGTNLGEDERARALEATEQKIEEIVNKSR